jgi:hypothetical protein
MGTSCAMRRRARAFTERHSGQREVGILNETNDVTRRIADGCHADSTAHVLRGGQDGNMQLLGAFQCRVEARDAPVGNGALPRSVVYQALAAARSGAA